MSTRPDDAVDVIRLWPDGPPSTIDGVGPEVAYALGAGVAAGTIALRNVSDPTLTVFAPAAERANGVGVIVVPGGGWVINAVTHEGYDVARWLTAHGCTAFVLTYRVQASGADQAAFEARMAAMDGALASPPPSSRRPAAIADLVATDRYREARDAAADDGRRAIAIVREHAARFGVRTEALGMIGFSAGAFLTADVALDPRGAPLAFAGAVYGGETRGAPVPADAPPLFAVVAQDDLLWRIAEGLHRDWCAADRPSELHVFARGGHGFGIVRQGAPSDRWPELFVSWLDDVVGLGAP